MPALPNHIHCPSASNKQHSPHWKQTPETKRLGRHCIFPNYFGWMFVGVLGANSIVILDGHRSIPYRSCLDTYACWGCLPSSSCGHCRVVQVRKPPNNLDDGPARLDVCTLPFAQGRQSRHLFQPGFVLSHIDVTVRESLASRVIAFTFCICFDMPSFK